MKGSAEVAFGQILDKMDSVENLTDRWSRLKRFVEEQKEAAESGWW